MLWSYVHALHRWSISIAMKMSECSTHLFFFIQIPIINLLDHDRSNLGLSLLLQWLFRWSQGKMASLIRKKEMFPSFHHSHIMSTSMSQSLNRKTNLINSNAFDVRQKTDGLYNFNWTKLICLEKSIPHQVTTY